MFIVDRNILKSSCRLASSEAVAEDITKSAEYRRVVRANVVWWIVGGGIAAFTYNQVKKVIMIQPIIALSILS